MKKNILILCTVLASMMIGCTGDLYTVKNATAKDKGDGLYLKGVTVYPPRLFVEVYENTAFTDKGRILRTSDGLEPDKQCQVFAKTIVVTRPDYTAPHQIFYDPGFLESNKFGVSLKDGMLTAVNTESAPDRGETIKNLTSGVAEVAGAIAPGFAPDGNVFCNDRPMLKKVIPYDDWST